MNEKAEVKKIVLDLGDKEIDLTPKQARMLADILGEMFSPKVQIYPQPFPVYVERPFYWPYQYDYTWCGASGVTAELNPDTMTVTLAVNQTDGLPENSSGDCYHADL